jgi:hypothetical protein
MQKIQVRSPHITRPASFAGASIPTEPAKYANLQLYNQVLPPGGTMNLDSGNFFFLLSNALAVNLLIQYPTGSTEIMNGIQSGSQIKRVKTWQAAKLIGTAGSLVSFWHGYEFSREDQTNFQSVIASISGNVSVIPGIGSANAPTDHAQLVIPINSLSSSVIPANALRKSVSVGSLSTNAGTINLRLQGGGGVASAQGVELQAGQFYNIATTAALSLFNGDLGVAQTAWYQEYT